MYPGRVPSVLNSRLPRDEHHAQEMGWGTGGGNPRTHGDYPNTILTATVLVSSS